jgi:hypothetical protein
VEIAGYTLSPALRQGLAEARLAPPPGVRQVLWLECSPRQDASLAPAGQATRQALQEAGCSVHAQHVQGPAFWQTTEIEDAPALLQATKAAVDALLEPVTA